MPQYRIGTRLAMSFAAVLALLIGLSAMVIFRMQQVSVALGRISSGQLENIALVAQNGESAEAAARKLIVLSNASRAERIVAYAEIDGANRDLDAGMKVLEARLPEGERRVPFLQVREKLQAYREYYMQNVDLIEAEDWVAARRMLVEQIGPALSDLAAARYRLVRSEHLAAAHEADRLEQRLRIDRLIVVGLCVLGLAVGAFLAAFVTRGIVRPLLHAEAVARRLTEGDYTRQVRITTDDEVGRVSSALNTLALAVSEREAALIRLSNTDNLTGLAQRSRFVTQGNEFLESLRNAGGAAALLCIDIDRLKPINAVLGFDAGDAAIVHAARCIEASAAETGRLARLAGGTFAVVLALDGSHSAQELAARVQGQVEHKVIWHGQSLDLSATVGIALWPNHAEDCEALLRRAEQAMFEAKRQRLRMATYVPSLEATRLSHLTLLSDLTQAIERGQLAMFVQPKVSPVDGRLAGVEALVRWNHPERGWVSPAEFIPFAESTGRVRQITQWMLERAIETLAAWQRAGDALYIAVNVSTLDLQDATLPTRVEAMLRAAGVAPHSLHLELTETGLMAGGPEPVAVLHALREIGVRLAIDDFGTGHSSLAYLQRLPVHELKIDRSFVDRFDLDARRRQLLGSIVALGHGLGLVVTAEGVERHDELKALGALGCDLVQGFLIAKPMAVADFDARRVASAAAGVVSLRAESSRQTV